MQCECPRLKVIVSVNIQNPKIFLDLLLNNYKQSVKAKTIEEDLGKQGADWYQMVSDYQTISGTPQARLPFVFKSDRCPKCFLCRTNPIINSTPCWPLQKPVCVPYCVVRLQLFLVSVSRWSLFWYLGL